MLEAWARQQSSRALKSTTIVGNLRVLRRFQDFSGLYPWEWTPLEVEAFSSDLLSGPAARALSTVRGYHVAIRGFCAYVASPEYPWLVECDKRFGAVPIQICNPENTISHLAAFEGRESRRGFTFDELETLFGAATERVERLRRTGKKGWLPAWRDLVMLGTAYAFGLRRQELVGLDLTDLRTSPAKPEWGQYGALHVRFGKSSAGGPTRRRTVLAVPEFSTHIEALRQWVEEVRPALAQGSTMSLWPSERRGRLSARGFESAFHSIRDETDLAQDLTLHSLRHSYVSHLHEFGYAYRFVQDQVGHRYGSSTAIYTSVGDDYRHAVVRKALKDYFELETDVGSDDRLEPPQGDVRPRNVPDQ